MWKNLSLLIGSLLTVFSLAEAGLRMLVFCGEISWSVVVYPLNSSGFREVEHRYQKNPQAYRIMVVGDFVAFSHKGPFEETFPGQLTPQMNMLGETFCRI
jgi:hypothetical protein